MGVFNLNFEVQDDDGDVASFKRYIPDTLTLAQVTEYARSYMPLLDLVIAGLIRACSVTIPVDISALTSNIIEASADVEEVGSFKFSTAAGTDVLVNIPGLDESVVAAGSDELDQANANVAAFITMMTAGVAVTGGTIAPCDIAESDVTAVVYARESFRASGRRS